MPHRFLLPLAFLVASAPAVADMDLDRITLPPGFSIELHAEVPNARSLALGDGPLLVSDDYNGLVYRIVYTAP